MSRSEQQAARASRLGREVARPTGAGDQVVSKVRRTVDLPPDHHHRLNRLCQDAAAERGWARVNSQDMLATLIAELLDDVELQRRIIGKLPRPAKRPGSAA